MAPAFTSRIFLSSSLAAAGLLLAACNPTFNWREVRPDHTALSLLLPCKPDKATRSVPLGGQATDLAMLGCETDGATFAVAVATLPDVSQVPVALAGWRMATLANIKAPGVGYAVQFKVPGAAPQPPTVLVHAEGRRTDGSAVQSQAVYFAHGRQVFQAVIYADRISPQVSETFFSSLKLSGRSPRP